MTDKETVGQIIGFIALFFFCISYQVKNKSRLIAVQTVATSLICVQYLLIGAYSGFALNVVCVVRNFAFSIKDKRESNSPLIPVLFAVLMLFVGAFSWEGYHSILILAGLAINTVCMGVCRVSLFRKTVILTCSLIFAYNLCVFSISGMINESISIVAAAVGILREYLEKKKEQGRVN